MKYKYIDAEKMKELISQVEKEFIEKSETKGYTTLEYRHKAEGLGIALQLINTHQQEQTEVELEKEVRRWKNKHGVVGMDDLWLKFACNFYEYGINTRKEE